MPETLSMLLTTKESLEKSESKSNILTKPATEVAEIETDLQETEEAGVHHPTTSASSVAEPVIGKHHKNSFNEGETEWERKVREECFLREVPLDFHVYR